MSRTLLAPAALFALAAVARPGLAAAPKEIDAAVQKGAAYLKQQYGGPKPLKAEDADEGIGVAALAGLAILEAGTPVDDASVAGIAAAVRDASFGEARTYHITLCLLFLDRLGDPADGPLVQMLGVRLLAGQTAAGGWSYDCGSVAQADMTALRAALLNAELRAGARPPAEPKPANPAAPARPAAAAGKLHAAVEKYAARLAASRDRNPRDDNSNTQFGVLGTWVARRHGVTADAALGLIEKRFLVTQTGAGGWPYGGHAPGSPSMTCAGLLGLATAVGLREERRLRADAPQKPDPAPKARPPAPPAAKSDDPFFNPPAVPKPADPFFDPPAPPEPKAKDAPKPKVVVVAPKPPADARDAAIERGLAALGRALAGEEPAGKGDKNRVLARRDFYFLWSLERVGVVYGVERIGGINWYQLGADELVAAQRANGAWGHGARGGVVDTSFAVLFLSRSNLVRDLTARVANDPANAELRAARDPAPETAAAPALVPEPRTPAAIVPPPVVARPAPVPLPTPAVEPAPAADARTITADLVGTPDADWDAALVRVRDGKGAAYTEALVAAVGRLDGERRRAARDALSERLTRMSADTLRAMARSEEAELRRGAVLAMAMKDDKAHLPDLVAALADADPAVARAALAGLKAVTGEDFGPASDATPAERAAAIRAWAEWVRKRK